MTATASARDLDFVAGLGARDVLDYSGRFDDRVGDVDAVIDPVGGVSAVFGLAALAEAFQAQRPARGPGKVVISVVGTGAR